MNIVPALFVFFRGLCAGGTALAAKNLALRHQIAVLQRSVKVPAADCAAGDWFGENHELARMIRHSGRDAVDGDAVLEFVGIVGGGNDRPVDAQYVEAVSVRTAAVLDEHYSRLWRLWTCLASTVLLTTPEIPGRVDERVERGCRYPQWIAGLDLFQMITHQSLSSNKST